MTRILFTFFICFKTAIIFSQSNGDYRTRVYGNWTQIGRWQVYYNGAWQNLEDASAGPYRNILPSHNSGVIMIKNHIRIASGSVAANQIVIQDGGQLSVLSGCSLTVVDDLVQTPILIESGGLLVNNGTVDLTSQLTTTPCEINGMIENSFNILTSNPSLLLFKSGATYKHLHRKAGTIPLAVWDINSTCVIGGLVDTDNIPPNNLGQTFGNVVWNSPSMGPTATFSLQGALKTVNGNLTFMNTGTTPREIRLNNGGPGYSLHVGGNFVVENGTVTLTQNQTSTTSITVGGDLIVSGGTLTLGTSNNAAVHLFLKGIFQKTNGVLARGTGTGVFVILPNVQ